MRCLNGQLRQIKYRGFYACVSSRNMERSELEKQTYYYYKVATGSQPNIVVRFNQGDTNTSTFRPTSW